MGERIERSALLRSRTRVTLDEQGKNLAVSDDAKNTFEEWGSTPDEVEQNFREWWYSDKPEELNTRIQEYEEVIGRPIDVEAETIVENFMIPDKTKPKKGRGGLIDFHKWKKKKKRKVMQDFLDDPKNAKNVSELMSALYRGRQRLDRIAGRLKKHPEDNVIKFPNKGRPDKFAGWVGGRKSKPKKPKKKPKKNMGGLLSLYE